MKAKKAFILILSLILIVSLFTGCRESDRVSYNVSKEADNFNVLRRVAVINARTDEPVFEMIGRLAIENTSTHELAILVEVSENRYKKHYIYLNEWTIYVVEDVSGAFTDPYHYEVNFLPEMIPAVKFTSND